MARDPRQISRSEQMFGGPFGGERARDKAQARRDIAGLQQGDADLEVQRYIANATRDLIIEQQETNRLLRLLVDRITGQPLSMPPAQQPYWPGPGA